MKDCPKPTLDKPIEPGDLKPGDQIGPFTVVVPRPPQQGLPDSTMLANNDATWLMKNDDVQALIDAFGVSVHKPETPVVMVKCHVPDGKYLGQELPEHMKGKDLRVIPESAIVMEDSMPPHMRQGQTYPWLAVTSSKLKFGQGKVYRIIVIEDREALGGNGA